MLYRPLNNRQAGGNVYGFLDNLILKIKQERDFFRTEAVRLNGLCKQMSAKIEDMTFRLKQSADDVNQLKADLKNSENANKQMMVEIESNIQEKNDLEKKIAELKLMQLVHEIYSAVKILLQNGDLKKHTVVTMNFLLIQMLM